MKKKRLFCIGTKEDGDGLIFSSHTTKDSMDEPKLFYCIPQKVIIGGNLIDDCPVEAAAIFPDFCAIC